MSYVPVYFHRAMRIPHLAMLWVLPVKHSRQRRAGKDTPYLVVITGYNQELILEKDDA